MGALGGAGYGQGVLRDHYRGVVNEYGAKSAKSAKSELESLNAIASELGIETEGKTVSDLKSDIRYLIESKQSVPAIMDLPSLEWVLGDLNRYEAKHALNIRKFLKPLQGKRVIVVGDDEGLPEEVSLHEGEGPARDRGRFELERQGYTE